MKHTTRWSLNEIFFKHFFADRQCFKFNLYRAQHDNFVRTFFNWVMSQVFHRADKPIRDMRQLCRGNGTLIFNTKCLNYPIHEFSSNTSKTSQLVVSDHGNLFFITLLKKFSLSRVAHCVMCFSLFKGLESGILNILGFNLLLHLIKKRTYFLHQSYERTCLGCLKGSDTVPRAGFLKCLYRRVLSRILWIF